MAASVRVWLLNFEVEAELESGSQWTPSRAMAARMVYLSEQVRKTGLVAPDDEIISGAGARVSPRCRGRAGIAWCPTPRALRVLALTCGRPPPPAPAFDVLRRVNHRRFSADLGRAIPGARWIEARADLDAALRGPSPTGHWLLRRPFGFSGRGRLRLDPRRSNASTERWIITALASGGGLEVTPWVERAGDFALHGHLDRSGTLTLGEPTAQRCDDACAWLESARAGEAELEPDERRALFRAAEEAASALVSAGYFGPFGIDGFRYRDEAGTIRFEPRCEINARYSMGWAVGMGSSRPDLSDD